jgi:hypothetical protein
MYDSQVYLELQLFALPYCSAHRTGYDKFSPQPKMFQLARRLCHLPKRVICCQNAAQVPLRLSHIRQAGMLILELEHGGFSCVLLAANLHIIAYHHRIK